MKTGFVILQIALLLVTGYLFYYYKDDSSQVQNYDNSSFTVTHDDKDPNNHETSSSGENTGGHHHEHGSSGSGSESGTSSGGSGSGNNNPSSSGENNSGSGDNSNNSGNNSGSGNHPEPSDHGPTEPSDHGPTEPSEHGPIEPSDHESDHSEHSDLTIETPNENLLITMEYEFPQNPPQIFKDNCGTCESYCHQRQKQHLTLCNIGVHRYCRRRYITEEISTFWILTPMYTANFKQTERLYYLHGNFRNYIKSYGISHQTVEVIFPGQDFKLTQPNNEPYDVQFKDEWIFCMRENLINVGVGKLPKNWAFMAWIDQHIFWEDKYWFEKAMWLMSHHNIVHLLNGNDFWSVTNQTQYHLEGFGKLWAQFGTNFWVHDPRQCGLAWSMRREIYDKLGGILDICIGTKCDLYQNYAFVGMRYTSQTSNGEYAAQIGAWQDHAIQVFDRKLGFLDSKVFHFEHCLEGCKTSDYNAHIYALMRHNYNPNTDLKRDPDRRLHLVNNIPLAKELWVLYGGSPRLRLLQTLLDEEQEAIKNNVTAFYFPHLFGGQN